MFATWATLPRRGSTSFLSFDKLSPLCAANLKLGQAQIRTQNLALRGQRRQRFFLALVLVARFSVQRAH